MSVGLEIEQPSAEDDSAGSKGGQLITRVLAGPGVSLLLMVIVSLATWTGLQANNIDPFVLQAPVTENWWQLPLSTFAHGGTAHLYGNATMIAIFGSIAVISSSVLRYHLFFITTGIVSSVAHVTVTAALGDPSSVLGASGAGMGLIAYVIVSNDVSDFILKHVSWVGVVVLVVGVAVGLTLWSAALEVANVSHFTGALIGVVAGYFHVLRVD